MPLLEQDMLGQLQDGLQMDFQKSKFLAKEGGERKLKYHF